MIDPTVSPFFFTRRIILLSGDPDAQDVLADALASVNPKLAVLSIEAPVYDCIMALNSLEGEAADLSELDPKGPFNAFPQLSNQAVFDEFKLHISKLFGPTFLAERCLAGMESLGPYFDAFAVTAISDYADLVPFVTTYPPDELLHISLAGLGETKDVAYLSLSLNLTPAEQLRMALRTVSPSLERKVSAHP